MTQPLQAQHTHPSDPPSTHLTATPIKWAAEHDAMLKAMVEEKRHSYSEIAAALNGTFDTGYSRNAAIGRANRMGLDNSRADQNLRPSKPKAERPHRPRPRIVRAAGNSPKLKLIYSVERDLAPLRCAEVIPPTIWLDQPAAGLCQYPYGDGPSFAFCGLVVSGAPYCIDHARICYLPPTKRNERGRGIR